MVIFLFSRGTFIINIEGGLIRKETIQWIKLYQRIQSILQETIPMVLNKTYIFVPIYILNLILGERVLT
jgi:hypothetical protein